jgi:hypothetical protein
VSFANLQFTEATAAAVASGYFSSLMGNSTQPRHRLSVLSSATVFSAVKSLPSIQSIPPMIRRLFPMGTFFGQYLGGTKPRAVH